MVGVDEKDCFVGDEAQAKRGKQKADKNRVDNMERFGCQYRIAGD